MDFSISESMTNLNKQVSCSMSTQRKNQIMKLKLVTVVLASAVALSSASASERIHRHNHYRNSYNSMNMMQAPAHGSSYVPGFSYGPSSGYPGGSNLSGTGPSQFGGGAADGAGGGGGGGP
jgi:hypothetical protein